MTVDFLIPISSTEIRDAIYTTLEEASTQRGRELNRYV